MDLTLKSILGILFFIVGNGLFTYHMYKLKKRVDELETKLLELPKSKKGDWHFE